MTISIQTTAQKIGNKDDAIDFNEWNLLETELKKTTGFNDDTLVTYRGTQIKWGELKKMKGFLVSPAEPKPVTGTDQKAIDAQTKIVADLHGVLETFKAKIDDLQKKIDNETVAAKKDALIKEKKILESKREVLVKRQKANLIKLKATFGAQPIKGKAGWWKMAGMTVPKSVAGNTGGSVDFTEGKAATTQAQPKSAQQQKPTDTAAKSGKATTTKGGWGPTSGGWGTQNFNGPKFSSAAYAQSLFMEDSLMNSWDNINKNQNRGQELMQLLFYYMRMAMSGDLTAMYNMMKAVLYIISKDKALQQVHMAKKLIQLQDESRRATDKLLNFNADQKDPNSQMSFTKLLQEVKSESDSIATSQKLVAQMMEEMAQIVETLTQVTKGALDAAGRVLRTVSRFN